MTDTNTFITSPVNRRTVLAGAAAGGAALALGTRGVFAAGAEKTIKVGFVSPRTGALAGFGEGDGYVLDLARKSLADGLSVAGTKYAVEILDRDSQSDPSRAGQLANDLINNDKVDIMLATSTPEVVNPVADACEAAGVPSLNTIVPWEAFYFGRGGKPDSSPFKWSFLFSFGTQQFANTYLSMWDKMETNKKVGVLYPNDADGNAIRANLTPLLEKGRYTVIDAGPYEDGTTDYSAQIALFKREQCEIFNSFPIPPDFAAFWRQAAQQGYTRMVKIAQIAKTGLFPSDISSLGSLGFNLATAAYWHKVWPYTSPLTGVSGTELADGYEAAAGKQWQQQLGATMSLFDASFEALKASAAPQSKDAVLTALKALKTTTMVGKVDFTSGPFSNISVTPIMGCQWVKAPAGSKFQYDLLTTDNVDDASVPVQAQLVPYNA